MMNDHDLPAIAQKAIEHVLHYHDSCHTGLTEPYKAIIRDRIEALLPLKSLAADPDVANIEIISDAAMSFLDAYNLEHLDNPLSQKWLYIGVQTLVSIDLKPALVCGEVMRLSEVSVETEARFDIFVLDRHDVPQTDVSQPDESQPDETEEHAAPQQHQQPEHELSATPPSDDEDTAQDKKAFADDIEWTPARTPRSRKRRSSGPHVANGKDPWSDEEIKKLIKWKVHGMTHKEAGAKLGRTEPACAIRHSIVLKQDRWIEFARAYREKKAAGEASDVEDESAAGEEGEQARENEEMNSTEKAKGAEQVKGIEVAKGDDDMKDSNMGDNEVAEDKEASMPLAIRGA